MKHTLDARGLTCPLPVINTKKELENISEEKEELKAVVAEKKEKLSNEPITR